MAVTIRIAAGFVCGADTGSPVWDKYKPLFPFTGTIYNVTVDVSGDDPRRGKKLQCDDGATADALMTAALTGLPDNEPGSVTNLPLK